MLLLILLAISACSPSWRAERALRGALATPTGGDDIVLPDLPIGTPASGVLRRYGLPSLTDSERAGEEAKEGFGHRRVVREHSRDKWRYCFFRHGRQFVMDVNLCDRIVTGLSVSVRPLDAHQTPCEIQDLGLPDLHEVPVVLCPGEEQSNLL